MAQRWGADQREDMPGGNLSLPGQNAAPAAGPPGRPAPTAAGQGALPEGVDQAWWGRAQRVLGDKAGSAEDLQDPQHRKWLNKQLKKRRQKKVGGGPQTGGPDPPPGGPQTGGIDPPPGAPPGAGPPGTTMTGWGGKTVAQGAGGGYTPVPGAPGGAAPTPGPAGYPGSPSYPQPGQGFPLPGAPGGPTGPGGPAPPGAPAPPTGGPDPSAGYAVDPAGYTPRPGASWGDYNPYYQGQGRKRPGDPMAQVDPAMGYNALTRRL